MPVPGLSRNCEDFSVDAVLSATLALRAEMLKITVSTDVKGEVSRGLHWAEDRFGAVATRPATGAPVGMVAGGPAEATPA